MSNAETHALCILSNLYYILSYKIIHLNYIRMLISDYTQPWTSTIASYLTVNEIYQISERQEQSVVNANPHNVVPRILPVSPDSAYTSLCRGLCFLGRVTQPTVRYGSQCKNSLFFHYQQIFIKKNRYLQVALTL